MYYLLSNINNKKFPVTLYGCFVLQIPMYTGTAFTGRVTEDGTSELCSWCWRKDRSDCQCVCVCVCVCYFKVVASSGQKLSDLKNGESGDVLKPVQSKKKKNTQELIEVLYRSEGSTFLPFFFGRSSCLLWKCEMFKMLETVCEPSALPSELSTRHLQLWCVAVFRLGGAKGPDGFDPADDALYSAVTVHQLGSSFHSHGHRSYH